jgi:hypothetical protein
MVTKSLSSQISKNIVYEADWLIVATKQGT